jgi:hypothetical protein
MTLDREYDLCPECYLTPFPSVWTMEYIGCVHCELRLPRVMMVPPDTFPAPAAAQTPPVALDRPRSPSICPFQNRPRKGKFPQARGRRSGKTLPPPAQEPRCCSFTSPGNPSLPCLHTNCSPLQTSDSSQDASMRTPSGSEPARTPLLLSVTRVVVVRLLVLCHAVLRYSPNNADPQFTNFR